MRIFLRRLINQCYLLLVSVGQLVHFLYYKLLVYYNLHTIMHKYVAVTEALGSRSSSVFLNKTRRLYDFFTLET